MNYKIKQFRAIYADYAIADARKWAYIRGLKILSVKAVQLSGASDGFNDWVATLGYEKVMRCKCSSTVSTRSMSLRYRGMQAVLGVEHYAVPSSYWRFREKLNRIFNGLQAYTRRGYYCYL